MVLDHAAVAVEVVAAAAAVWKVLTHPPRLKLLKTNSHRHSPLPQELQEQEEQERLMLVTNSCHFIISN